MGHTSVERGHEWRGLTRACCRRGVWPDRKHAGRGDLLFRAPGQQRTTIDRRKAVHHHVHEADGLPRTGIAGLLVGHDVRRRHALYCSQSDQIVTASEAMTTLDATRTAPLHALLAAARHQSRVRTRKPTGCPYLRGRSTLSSPQLCACTAGSRGIEKSGNLPRPAASYAGWLGIKIGFALSDHRTPLVSLKAVPTIILCRLDGKTRGDFARAGAIEKLNPRRSADGFAPRRQERPRHLAQPRIEAQRCVDPRHSERLPFAVFRAFRSRPQGS